MSAQAPSPPIPLVPLHQPGGDDNENTLPQGGGSSPPDPSVSPLDSSLSPSITLRTVTSGAPAFPPAENLVVDRSSNEIEQEGGDNVSFIDPGSDDDEEARSEGSFDIGNSSDDDDISSFDFSGEDEGVNDGGVFGNKNEDCRNEIISAYLFARMVDQEFQRNIQMNEQGRSFASSDSSCPAVVEQKAVVQERWFFATETIEGPYFGFSPLANKKIGELPENYSAHFPPRSHSPPAAPSNAVSAVSQANKLITNFKSAATGQYTLYLRVKTVDEEPTTLQLTVRIMVQYTEAKMADTYYTKFTKREEEGGVSWHYLKAQSQFEVRAHVGVAQVNVRIEQDDKYNTKMRGKLWVQSLELVPVGSLPNYQDENQGKVYTHVDWSGRPGFSIATQPRPEDPGVVTRVVTSKESNFFAALTVFSTSFTVHVWAKNEVMPTNQPDHTRPGDRREYNPRDISQLGAVSESIECLDASNISLELAISPNGKYIAVFQAPSVGSWQEGTKVPDSNIGVRLFHNPLRNADSNSTLIIVQKDQLPGLSRPYLGSFSTIPSKLRKAVGFAKFVYASEEKRTDVRFVFCNGLYLYVFDVHDNKLSPSHTISIANKGSSLLCTVACEFMMSSITNNMFMWVEDNGRHCSAWDLSNGTLRYCKNIGTTAMKIACNHNTIAIVGAENSITTLDASSGITIGRRIFKQRLIEHIEFPSAQSDMLFVLLRCGEENEQTVIMVDPLRLDARIEAPLVPPLSRSNVFGHLGTKRWDHHGTVFQLDGNLIHCHIIEEPTPSSSPRFRRMSAVPSTCSYVLRIVTPPLQQDSDEAQESCKRQVEIWKKDSDFTSPGAGLVFSFIPEPWELQVSVNGMILPSGDRFVVYACWTVQVWSLPTATDPRCRLLFFWSALNSTEGTSTHSKTEMENVLDYHCRFDAIEIHEFPGKDQAQFQASMIIFGKVKQVRIPNALAHLVDYRNATKRAIDSVWLLALAHTIISSGCQDLSPMETGCSYDYHASAIMDFVNKHINHSLPGTEADIQHSLLKHLLLQSCPKSLSTAFIVSLLRYDKCSWVPRIDQESHLIQETIRCKNTAVVKAILDYCAKKAEGCYANYTMPVESSFGLLSETYSGLLQDFFRKTSYLPARRDDLNSNGASISIVEWKVTLRKLTAWIPSVDKPALEHYLDPVLTFQLQKKSATSNEKDRINKFSRILPAVLKERYDYQMYIVPFSSLIALGGRSQFRDISGKNYFDSPALLAVLRYKWWQYGLKYWVIRYLILLIFYGLFMIVTVNQLERSENLQTPEDMQMLYLDESTLRIIIADITFGSFFIVFEVVQLFYEGPGRYLGTLLNYIDLVAIISCIISLVEIFRRELEAKETGSIPDQFEFVPYAIVAMYLHLIVEVRVFRPIGVIVNILVQTMMRMGAFFFVFILMVIAFTHALIYLLFVYQRVCEDSVCKRPEVSKYPFSPIPAFVTTLFFLAGRYDPIDDDFEDEKSAFIILMVLFYILCFIVMLTVLIAQVSDAFNDAYKDGERAWRKQLSATLNEAEMVGRFFYWLRIWRDDSQPKPFMIYYMALGEDADEYKENLKEKK